MSSFLYLTSCRFEAEAWQKVTLWMLEMQQVALINYEEKLVCELFSPQEMKTITSTRIKGTKLKDFYHVIMRKQEIKIAFGSRTKTVIYVGFLWGFLIRDCRCSPRNLALGSIFYRSQLWLGFDGEHKFVSECFYKWVPVILIIMDEKRRCRLLQEAWIHSILPDCKETSYSPQVWINVSWNIQDFFFLFFCFGVFYGEGVFYQAFECVKVYVYFFII